MDAAAEGRKRKRAKKNKDRSAASAMPDGSSPQEQPLRRHQSGPAFAVGSHAAAPATRMQLAGLDDSEFTSAVTALEEYGLVHFTDVALPLDFLTLLRSEAAALSDQIETALRGKGIQYQLE